MDLRFKLNNSGKTSFKIDDLLKPKTKQKEQTDGCEALPMPLIGWPYPPPYLARTLGDLPRYGLLTTPSLIPPGFMPAVVHKSSAEYPYIIPAQGKRIFYY